VTADLCSTVVTNPQGDQTVVQMVSCQSLTELQVQFQASHCGIFGGQRDKEINFSQRISIFAFHRYSFNASFSFLHSSIMDVIQP
jgi:hypothetical protein